MTIVLDGALLDWTADDRLETTTNAVAGYAVYGRLEADVFYFALSSAVAIGETSTLWLNTDADTATGYQVWGFAAGAEFNVNFGTDGVPRLYTGADGQTLVGDLTYAMSADGTVLEIALPKSMLGETVSSVGIMADINNSVFLPVDYTFAAYTISAPVVSVYDGLLTEWTPEQRLDTPANGLAGYAIYGKVEGDDFVFGISSAVPIGANTTFWLNTDGDLATGYQIWGWAGGAEFNVNIDANGVARLYSGGAGEVLVGTIEYKIAADGLSMEFAVPKALLGPSVTSVVVLADINDGVFLPPSYAAGGYVVVDPGTVPAGPYDGLLTEWTAEQRLDTGANSVAGYELYGKVENDSFVFGLASAVPIGQNTTFWLNTDSDIATGYQIWGWAGGAEFNVNISADGVARLYSGADGQTLVGEIDYKIAPDGLSMEFAVPRSLIGASVTAVTLLADVNNSVFLPPSYAAGGLTLVDPAWVPASQFDGVLDEWTASQRLETPMTTIEGYEFYGQFSGEAFHFGFKSAVAIGPNTTFWLNTDGDTSTGTQVFGYAGGAEFNVNIGADGIARLYSGQAGQTLVGVIDHKLGPDGMTMEFAIPRSMLGAAVTAVSILADVNDSVYLPSNYLSPAYTVYDPSALPAATETGNKIAILFSQTTAENYFSTMAYSQLVMAAQSQAMAAGIPFDLISEADLADLSKMVNYDTIIFPSFRNVPANYVQIQDVLTKLVYEYDVSLIAGGDFMTNDADNNSLPNNAYERMEILFGISRTGGDSGVVVEVHATAAGHPITEGYGTGGAIQSYAGAATSYFAATNPAAGSVSVIAEQTVGGATYAAVLGSVTGSRNVHFATDAVLADANLLGQAIDWVSEEAGGPSVSLHMTRNASLFASRNDMDQSQETYDVDGGIYDALMPILQQWKTDYNFVGSYYVNIGFDPPDQETNWFISSGYYDAMRAMGNEIGSHSYSHPEDTNLLLPDVMTQALLTERIAQYAAQPGGPGPVGQALATMTLEEVNAKLAEVLAAPDPDTLNTLSKAFLAATYTFQFATAREVLEANLGYPVGGAAVPGMPDSLYTAEQIMQHYDYLSGGAALVGAGYPGAIGYLAPDSQEQVYIAPNMSFDFTLMGWLGLTVEQAEAKWAEEWAELNANSDMPIVVWPWHDYGVTVWPLDEGETSPYSEAMFTNFIAAAYAAGTEFVTLADLAARIRAFEQADFAFSVSGDVITMTATPQTGQLGTFALNLDDLGGKTIQSVTNWYAYDADSVFLDADGGSFEVLLGTSADDVTHITSIGSRAQLMSITGNGNDLDFTIIGEGRVVIDVKQGPGLVYLVWGASVVSQVGDILTIDLGGIGSHTVAIREVSTNLAPTDIVLSNQIVLPENLAERTKIADLTILDADVDPLLRLNVVTVSDDRFEIDGTTGALYLKAGQSVDFEATPTIEMTLTSTDGATVFAKPISISVSNVNDAPSDIVVSNQASIVEGTSLRTLVADLAIVDPDLVAEFRNNVVSVSDDRFEIDGTTGSLYLKAGQVIDYEAGSTIALTLTATDGALSFAKAVILTVTNVNELPSGAPIISGAAVENVTLSANVSLVTDPDGLGTFSYQWQRGDGTAFTNIAGAIAATYGLVQADTDQLIRVAVSYLDGGATLETVFSAPTSQVVDVLAPTTLEPLLANTTRTITAAELVGGELSGSFTIDTLTASIGTLVATGVGEWTYAPPVNDQTQVSFTYTATAGAKLAQGTAGMDLLPSNTVYGTSGDDSLAARASADTYRGFEGNDIISAGGGNDIIYGDEGNDTASGGGGADTFRATLNDGNDAYAGNAGLDLYDLSETSAAALVNLTTGTSTSAQTGSDTLGTIENVIGSSGNDTIIGSGGANVLEGGAGDDNLSGMGGADTLIGGDGADILRGGAGRDVMTGGADSDVFIFAAVSDSRNTVTTRDVITDFTPGEDYFDFSAIDANTLIGGDQAFTFLDVEGSAFTGVRGQLRWVLEDLADTANDRTIVLGDMNGDQVSDFQVELTGLITLGVGDFIL
ncbi:M10 family metallopeptidase C-terminal domain-containing protein [Devosia sp. XJ19-1]|uniref:M10 family metallopeptidase C-terminal domain-containing protein n=1 Tax=Devosia ureilytica TaxID=2952754 RepID=UPI0020C7C3F8|nr:M10 family metallopeptidase C-terminal domain-containing protein [Devosia ureilytica]MCP8883719.1 M10 family metallopeptidase C-terminal domain-containing protein [Devosia ureilytica]